MIDNFLPIMTTKNTLQHKKNHKNTKEDYTHKSKSIGEKIGFSAVFADIIKRGALFCGSPLMLSFWLCV